MMLNYYDITCKFHELVVIAIILNLDNLLNDCIDLQRLMGWPSSMIIETNRK